MGPPYQSLVRVGSSHSFPDPPLLDVLVVPRLTKNLLSISKLTSDLPFKVIFIDSSFVVVQNRVTNQVVATGRRDDGLYVLERGQAAFISILNKSAL